jgi:phosphoribosylaminoimidazole-succinocarboxamide synthase
MSELQALTATNYFFRNQIAFYRGKVRDVYYINKGYLAVVACDRISAFDHVLPRSIPYKGQVLNEIASLFLKQTADIVPNWLIETPDPHVSFGYKADAIAIEFVVRNYLTGHAWRVYKEGGRMLCGNKLPDGLKENDKLPQPIITPSTKAHTGHDVDISYSEIIEQGIVDKSRLDELNEIALQLFQRGTEYADRQNLILVDTKYEFGIKDNAVMLIDEIHTPDSSRFFYKESYQDLQYKGLPQRQLSKEFVREWLMANGFQGKEGELIPTLTDEFVNSITDRYEELYKAMAGKEIQRRSYQNIDNEIEANINNCISKYL